MTSPGSDSYCGTDPSLGARSGGSGSSRRATWLAWRVVGPSPVDLAGTTLALPCWPLTDWNESDEPRAIVAAAAKLNELSDTAGFEAVSPPTVVLPPLGRPVDELWHVLLDLAES